LFVLLKEFQIKGGLWDGYNLYDLYKEAQTPYKWHKPLFDYAKEIGITIFSTPFDETAVELLEELEVFKFDCSDGAG
jgi:N-acetylneuraminate synthase